jgi:hypothetical protein
MTKLTVKFIRENVIGADSVSHKNGVFTVRHEFFYTHGHTADDFAQRIKQQLETLKIAAEIVDRGSEYKPFRGGAGVARNSHWWVKVRINEIHL